MMTTTTPLLLLLAAALVLAGVQPDDARAKEDTVCSTKRTCADCIRSPDCVWCGDPDIAERKKRLPVRCRARNFTTANWCERGYVIDEEPTATTLENNKLRDSIGDDVAVQIGPQSVKVRLRVGTPHDLEVRYRHASDYPVDLYYLMDLSASMEPHKNNLSEIGENMASTMGNLTKNVKLGFGSFVDKVAMPYTSTVPEKLINPCTGRFCAPPFGFKHNLDLTTDTEKFKIEVSGAKVSGNLDWPEGGMDALMQAMVCPQIGWRKHARRMIIFLTDATYHIAGDGRLAGIVEPNDGQCHLDSNGLFTESLNMDYPSITQINRAAKNNSMVIIFAVTKKVRDVYKRLANRIAEASTSELNNNVVKIVVDQYKKLSDLVRLKNEPSERLEVRYFSKCLNNSNATETSECGGMKRGTEVAFTVKITATGCKGTGAAIENETLEIYPAGTNEKVTINVEIICGCNCNKNSMSGKNASRCSHHGDLECGLCQCHEGYLGDHCNCDSDSNSPSIEDTSSCKDANNVTCSDHGTCMCNECQCAERPNEKEKYFGRLCEYDNFSCKRHDSKVCAGNGDCSYDGCVCRPGWSGEACECAVNLAKCRRPEDSMVCSGRGRCECGECMCDSTEDGHRYSGQYCEECPSCPGALCKDLENCTDCRLNSTKMLTGGDPCLKCGDISVVDDIEYKGEDAFNSYDSDLDKLCRMVDAQGCYLHFRYRSLGQSLKIWIQKEKDCGPNIWGVIFGVIGATVFLGLLIIIIWKICTTIHDKREYAKFEKERALSKWDRGGNPLYTPSTTTFTNPTFNKS